MARWKWFLADLAALLFLWSAVSLWVPGADQVLPAVPIVVAEMVELAKNGALVRDVEATVIRVFEGFLLAVATGVPLGLLFGVMPRLFRLVEPLIEVVRPISPIAWIPLSILWFGIGEVSKIFIIWLISFFFVLLSTVMGVSTVNFRLIEVARTLGASSFFIWHKIILPAALPSIFLGLRLGLGVSIGGVVIAEMVAANAGLGFLMERSRVVLNPAPVIVGMIMISAIGYIANRALVRVEQALLSYRDSVSLQQRDEA
jgi:ABC-type nitrate/sulfonate/bicarbonate transport system permease component